MKELLSGWDDKQRSLEQKFFCVGKKIVPETQDVS